MLSLQPIRVSNTDTHFSFCQVPATRKGSVRYVRSDGDLLGCSGFAIVCFGAQPESGNRMTGPAFPELPRLWCADNIT
jgi:hypothetical protein